MTIVLIAAFMAGYFARALHEILWIGPRRARPRADIARAVARDRRRPRRDLAIATFERSRGAGPHAVRRGP